MKRTSQALEEEVMRRIFAGDLYKEIAEGTGVAVSTIKKIKKRNYEMFWAHDTTRKVSMYDEMRLLTSRANHALSRKLDRQGEDMSVRDLLNIIKAMDKRIAIKSPPIKL